MNLLLVERHEIDTGHEPPRVALDDRRARHLLDVLRVEAGREVRLGVVDGARGHGRVLATGEATVEIELLFDPSQAVEEPPSGVELVVALPRPQALHRLLQTVAAMGVERLDLVNAWRVEKSFFASPSTRPEAIRRHLLLGAEQGMTTRLPEVTLQPLLVPFLEQRFQSPDDQAPALRLLCHPGVTTMLEQPVIDGSAGRCVLAIGAEGGWIDREVETLTGHGFRAVSLGPWVLRVEVALAAALAQLEQARRLRNRLPRPGWGAC